MRCSCGRSGLSLGPAIAIVAAPVPGRALLSLLRALLVAGGEIERSNFALAVGDIAWTLTIVALALADALSVEVVLGALWISVLLTLALHATAVGRPQRPSAGSSLGKCARRRCCRPTSSSFFSSCASTCCCSPRWRDARGRHLCGRGDLRGAHLARDRCHQRWRPAPPVEHQRRRCAGRDGLGNAYEPATRPARAVTTRDRRTARDPRPVRRRVSRRDRCARRAAAFRCRDGVWRALSTGLVRFGRTRTVNAVAFSALLLNVALNVVRIEPLGITGKRLA